MKKGLGKKLFYGTLSCFMVISQMTFVHAAGTNEGRNLKQQSIDTIENMPNLPSNYKLIDWLQRGKNLDEFLFDYTATNTQEKTEFSVKDGRTFATIYRDDKYGGYMIPAFYGENRPITNENGHDGEDDQESIATVSALIAASLMGIDKNTELPDELKGQLTIDGGYQINTYLDNALKYFWKDKGDVFTNVPNGSESKLQNKETVSNAYGDFWYLLIANQNFYRLADLNPDWRPEEIKELQEKVADKMVKMVDILMETDDKFNIQCFDFEHMEAIPSQWRQPDSAVGTANILYYAYKIFKDTNPDKAEVYLEHAKTCMDYLDGLDYNPYYENMLIDAVYLSTMMNAEVGTHYNTSKYIEWITTPTRSAPRNWGGVNYTQDGIDVYGMTGEPSNGYCYFFNSIYPMTSILPAAKYDPSYARMAGKWAINIANASRYFLPTEWSEEHQTDGDYIGKAEGDVLAYESLRKNDNGQNFYATGDAKQNATTGWKAGPNTTNYGIYGGVYTGYLGALIEETNVEGILKLDCNKTDYYQNNMYDTYLYYNPYMESKDVEIDLGNKTYDLFDSVTGTYVAKNVTGKQTIKLLADSAKVIVLAPANSTVTYSEDGTTTYIDKTLVAHSDAEVLPDQGTDLITNITVEGPAEITKKEQIVQYTADIEPTENVMDSRIIWSVTDKDGNPTDKATISKDGKLTVKKNGTVKVIASSIDGSGIIGEKEVQISGQTLASLSQGKETTVSSVNDNHGGNLAVDGDTTTRWIANAGEEHPWIYVDLGATANIDLIVLNWEAARPPKYRIQVSNDHETWTDIASVNDEGNSNKVVRFDLDETKQGRYVRIYADQKSNYGCSLYEFDVYGSYEIKNQVTSIAVSAENNADKITTKNKPLQMIATVGPNEATDKRVEWFVYNEDGSETTKAEITAAGKLIPLENGVVKVVAKAVDGSQIEGTYNVTLENQDKDNLALGKTVYVSKEEGSNPKGSAVDGKLDTRWACGEDKNNDSKDEWITVDLGDIYDVDKVVLYWEAAYAKKYKIQGSLDNKTFTDIYEEDNSDGGTDEITFEPHQARYIRMKKVQRAGDYGCSLWEFEVYGNAIEKTLAEEINVSSGLEDNTVTFKQQEVQMSATILPEDATDKSVTWSVVNEDGSETKKATISKDGVLTAKENGVVKVIATANDGSKTTGSTLVTITNQDAENIALNKTATSASVADGTNAQNVVDGKLNTRWASEGGSNDRSIEIDLGDLYYVNQVILNWETAYGKRYQILGSTDGENWTPLYEENNGNGGIDNLVFDQQIVRYVKMQGIERGTEWGYSLYEFEVYGKALKADLQSLYNEYKDIQADSYTPNSYSAFKTALDHAKDVLENAQATENDVQEAYNQLEDAKTLLAKQADKEALGKAIEKANSISEGQYTPNSVEAFQKIVAQVQVVYDDKNATQNEVDAAVATLTSAQANLVERADNSALKAAIDNAKVIDKGLYTPSSVEEFNKVISEAEKVLANGNATEDEIANAINSLTEAYGKLEARADNSQLETLIEEVKGTDKQAYTSVSYQALQVAIEEAKKVLNDPEATEEEINAAIEKVNQAKNGLAEVQRDPLKDVLFEANAVDQTKYTAASLKELETAIKNAEAALKTTDQKKIDEAYAALKKAYEGLEEKEENTTKPEEPGESQEGTEGTTTTKPDDPNQDKPDSNKPGTSTKPEVTTGDKTPAKPAETTGDKTPNKPGEITVEEVTEKDDEKTVTPVEKEESGKQVKTSDEAPIMLLTLGLIASGMGYAIIRKRKEI